MCLNKAVKKRERINQKERDQMREAESGAHLEGPLRDHLHHTNCIRPCVHQLHKTILSWVDASTQTDRHTDKQTQCVRQTGRQTDRQ